MIEDGIVTCKSYRYTLVAIFHLGINWEMIEMMTIICLNILVKINKHNVKLKYNIMYLIIWKIVG